MRPAFASEPSEPSEDRNPTERDPGAPDVDLAAPERAPDGDPTERDRGFMREALRLARDGARAGEVPVGALVVMPTEAGEPIVLGSGFNRPIGANDPTAHAEIVALRKAASRAGNYRLTGADLFVTLEPCLMCLGAAIHARIDRVVFGAADPRVGAVSQVLSIQDGTRSPNHRLAITGGVEAEASAALLREFFAARRVGAPASERDDLE